MISPKVSLNLAKVIVSRQRFKKKYKNKEFKDQINQFIGEKLDEANSAFSEDKEKMLEIQSILIAFTPTKKNTDKKALKKAQLMFNELNNGNPICVSWAMELQTLIRAYRP